MSRLAQELLAIPRFGASRVAVDLILALTGETGLTGAGYPYLSPECFARVRDHIPLLFSLGSSTYQLLDDIETASVGLDESESARESFVRALKVVRTMLRTACVTAPPDLWLLRYVLGAYKEIGFLDRVLLGERIEPSSCMGPDGTLFPKRELVADLGLLLSRGYLYESHGDVFSARHPRAVQVLEKVTPIDFDCTTEGWRAVFSDERLPDGMADQYLQVCWQCPKQAHDGHRGWLASIQEIEIGWRLVPIVLALKVTGVSRCFLERDVVEVSDFNQRHESLVRAALNVLVVGGALIWVEDGAFRVTPLGRRMFERGPGPFGIIEAYHPYMRSLIPLLRSKNDRIWVERGANVAASQDANRKTFQMANDALDEFCARFDFSYSVFIEHALGRGEAIRQRLERSGDGLQYVGADLEDAAINAARGEQAKGNLPAEMLFVPRADIGNAATLLEALSAANISADGAVMIVGNGFHEVRDRSDDEMVEVFRQYEQAGIVLLFTEESALSVDDLLETAWNTYHAGFKYVHEKSGQRLRPALPGPPNRFGEPLRASWQECAERAGYVRIRECCSRGRRVYPYKPSSTHNPAISVNHFIVPTRIANQLGYKA